MCGEIEALSLWNHLRLAVTAKCHDSTEFVEAHEEVLRQQIGLAQKLFNEDDFVVYSQDVSKHTWPGLLIEPTAVVRDIWPQLFTKEQLCARAAKYKYDPDARSASPFSLKGFRMDIGHSANSCWEANVFRVFRYLGGRYQRELRYELTGTDGRQLIYFVDILDEDGVLVPAGTFIEVKGLLLGESWAKICAFREAGHQLTVIGNGPYADVRYDELERTYRPLLPMWEHSGHNISTHPELYGGEVVDHG